MNLNFRIFRRALPFLALGALLPIAVGCPGVIEIKSKHEGGLKTATVAPILYDDFEKGLNQPYKYACTDSGSGAKFDISEDSQVFHSGHKSLRCDYQSGVGSYGGGFGWVSPYMPKAGYFDAKGTLGLEFWAKAPRGAIFQASVKEGMANGGDGEVYLSPQGTGTGNWKRYSFKWENFTRSIYSGNQAGDDQLAVSSIVEVAFQLSEKQGDGQLWIDDIYFK
jgi:hypothetical protein